MPEVWIVLLEGFDLFEVSAAMRTFKLANEALGHAAPHDAGTPARYAVRTFAAQAGPVHSNGESALHVTALPNQPQRAVDRLIVAGGHGAVRAVRDLSQGQQQVVEWIARQAERIRSLASIGEEGFVVGQAASARASQLGLTGGIDTIAASSGMGLALHIVAHDRGQALATQIAQRLSPSADRLGAPLRFRTSFPGEGRNDERVLALHRWISLHLRQPLTNEHLARRLPMTQRTFARFYRRATGITPARAVELLRIETACVAIEDTLLSLKAVASHCGFSSEEVMRRAFIRVLKMSPSQYRDQFHRKT